MYEAIRRAGIKYKKIPLRKYIEFAMPLNQSVFSSCFFYQTTILLKIIKGIKFGG